MNIYDKNHPHNAVFCEMLQSVIDGSPKTVQYRGSEQFGWVDRPKNETGITESGWNTLQLYRIKPVMATRTYPAPMTVAPAIGTKYFIVLIDSVDKITWSADYMDKKWLAAGICHLKREFAQEQWDAFYGVQK